MSVLSLVLLLLQIKMKPVLRRLLTRGLAVIPAVIVAAVMGDKAVGQLLVISQVGDVCWAAAWVFPTALAERLHAKQPAARQIRHSHIPTAVWKF
jgi:Mn2+/Fe2+ NRAMP family transporter